jgi:adenosylcobyric acid synthase
LPGSKQTADDLIWLRRQGLVDTIEKHADEGLLVGICGGMQMLGVAISDPHGIEHDRKVEGLGILPLSTSMNQVKVTRQVHGRTHAPKLFGQDVAPITVSGYEIHMGETTYHGSACGFAVLDDGTPDGCIAGDGRIFGTYLHGMFDDDTFRRVFIGAARCFCKLTPATEFARWKELRDASLNHLADTVRRSLELEEIFGWADLVYREDRSVGPAR